jgi:peptidoglycan/LPS O-acetylase OafA/YrhL
MRCDAGRGAVVPTTSPHGGIALPFRRAAPHRAPSPSVPDGSPRPRLASLDGLRFAAAMHVVVFHTFHADWLPARLMRPLTWGSASTSLLFVLSGFILSYTYAGADGRLRIPARDFLLRRATRLLPLNAVAHLLTLPLVWYAYPHAERGVRAALALLGLQAWSPTYATSLNAPGWSVSALLFGYAAMPALLGAMRGWSARRCLAAFAGVWAAAVAVPAAYLRWGAGDAFGYSLVNHLPPVRMLELALGVVLAQAWRAGWRAPAWAAPAGLAGWLAATVVLPDGAYLLVHNGLLAPFHALLLMGLARGDGLPARVLARPAFVRLGEASLPIFLLHVPLYSWVMLPLTPLLSTQPAAVRWGAYLAYLAATVVVSVAAERWVVRGTTQRLRALTRAGGAPVPPSVAQA